MVRRIGVWLMAGLLGLPAAVMAEDGAQSFQKRCALCHGAEGRGQEGSFPPLRDTMADWLATPEGRLYVATFVVHGPNGTVTVGGKHYTGMMPMYRWRMKDPEMIAVLRYVAETLNTPKPGYVPFDTAVVTQARAIPDDEALIHGMRARLPPR
jgi:nitrite reductase (NO-forming)